MVLGGGVIIIGGGVTGGGVVTGGGGVTGVPPPFDVGVGGLTGCCAGGVKEKSYTINGGLALDWIACCCACA